MGGNKYEEDVTSPQPTQQTNEEKPTTKGYPMDVTNLEPTQQVNDEGE